MSQAGPEADTLLGIEAGGRLVDDEDLRIVQQSLPVRDIAEVIGRHLNVPVASVAGDQAAEHFGFLGPFFAADLPASSAMTQYLLDWHPEQPGLIADLEEGHYFTRKPVAAAS